MKIYAALSILMVFAFFCAGAEEGTDRMELKNRLGEETSPYLLQHAENPVHWQPWDSLAFQAARELDRPIFLSIGYSTCHWCHVMEEESFQDSAVAELMNEAFVCIKVDREERPDVDNVYMRYAMAMTGSGGWPLNVVITPEGDPFFAATYIPRRTSMGRRGMMELVPLISQAWKNRREEVVRSSQEISASVFQQTAPSGPGSDADLPGQCLDQLTASYDSVNGGFGRAPKFPSLHNVMFLLRAWKNRGSEEALNMAITTLAAIRYGGVYDRLAGGVHRYSTDSRWNVPHFEKMLYDQAMLILASLEGYQAAGSGVCRQTARETADFLLREMRSPEGGFYSALDADSEEGEGAFYTWTPEEVRGVLSSEQMERFSEVWSLQDGAEGGRSVIRVPAPANWRNLPDRVPSPGEDVVQALLAERRAGPSPFMDRKIIAHWNGLAAAALARAYMVLGEREYLQAAVETVELIEREMILRSGMAAHSRMDGETSETGFLDDQAALVWACIELHNATLDDKYLNMALSVQRVQDSLFFRPETGLYSFSEGSGEGRDIPETFEVYDGALPSGNSVSLMNLYRLWAVTGDSTLRERANELARAMKGRAAGNPAAHTMFASALLNGPGHAHITFTGDMESEEMREMMKASWKPYLPDLTVSRGASDGEGASAEVCVGGACLPPVETARQLGSILQELPSR